MKNTLAVGLLILGGVLAYSGFKNWTVADTLRFFTGQEVDPGHSMSPEDLSKLQQLMTGDGITTPEPGTIENGGALPGIGAPPPTAAGSPPDPNTALLPPELR